MGQFKRLSFIFVATTMGISSASGAAVVVQQSGNQAAIQGAFNSFDTSLGTLNSVSLFVSTTDWRELWVDGYYGTDPVSLAWTINGNVTVGVYPAVPTSSGSLGPFSFPIAGAGSGTFAAETNVSMIAAGAATFDLDPAFFLTDYAPGWFDVIVRTTDLGLYNYLDTTVVTDQPQRVHRNLGHCYGNVGGDEACNFASYTLTYNYTPFASVPEPSTWFTMLFGFGAAGVALRRRRRQSGRARQ